MIDAYMDDRNVVVANIKLWEDSIKQERHTSMQLSEMLRLSDGA
jgi:hypothetical protein